MQEWNDVHTNEVAFTKYTHFVGTGIASPLSFPPASAAGSGGSHVFHISPGKTPSCPLSLVSLSLCSIQSSMEGALNSSLCCQSPLWNIPCLPIVKVKVAQSCNPMDCIVPGILQARIQEWVPFPFSRVTSQPRDHTSSPSLHADSLAAEPTREAREYWSG